MKHLVFTWMLRCLLVLSLGACIPLSTPTSRAPEAQPTAPAIANPAETAPPAATATSSTAPVASPAASAVTPAVAPAATCAVTVTAAARVPLKDAIAGMEPQAVWQNFYDLTQVPRPSHHEEQVRDFLVQFGKGLGLETIVDGAGNVLIRKPAAAGMENREGVVLQAHMDMVAQPQDGTHDFLTEPIDAYVEGDWVVADGTTLGADDGIGVALAMAVLQSQTPLGPIEALFTVNEEDGMDGALGLQPGQLQGTILINLDWETEGTFAISSAGGEYAHVKAPYDEVNTPGGMQAYQVRVSGLTGGHSGTEINLGRGHATKLLVRLLSVAASPYSVRLAEITGGTAANAIPQVATALVTVPATQGDAFLEYVGEYQEIVRAELEATEPNLAVGATPADLPSMVMSEEAQRTILDALYGTPQGVMRMSDVVPDLVETSTNVGIVQGIDGELDVTCYPRSSVDTELDDIAQMIASVWDLGGVEVTFDGRYPGWKANPDSPILALMKDVYHDLYGVDPDTVSVHAGMETGVIQAAYPGMDAISIGPTLQDVHTPEERLEVASVKKLADLLTETLGQVPTKAAQPAPSPAPAALPAAPEAVTATQVITYLPGPPTGEPQEGNCWTSSLTVWREGAWRCTVDNALYDPCFSTGEGVICGADPNAATTSFLLLLTEPLPAPEVPQDTTGHAWQVELADGTVCAYATGATGGVGDERINYFCPSPDPSQDVVILGDLQPDAVWMAHRAVLTGSMPDLTVLESAEVPVRTVWR
jgi:dipeptidase D